MINHIVNYLVRIVIICIGIYLLIAEFPTADDTSMIRVIGSIMVLFGVYRVIMYRINQKKYNGQYSNNKDKDDDYLDDNDDEND